MIYFKNLLYVLVFFTVIVIIQCAPLPTEDEATILSYEYTNDGKGNYDYRFETSNGIIRKETGTLIDAGLPTEHILVRGSYSYYNPEGKEITVSYIADERGYNILTSPKKYSYSSPVSPAVLATLLG
ncbi:endocuticle structural glycoprotein SgAbd-5-like [Vanessa cardui]|uniref:endocuticle structural glycoprotein SgAbd-5-like n=1 Tax=Vanessa cardui TaxID=171605 RepID=UPI001F129BAA|nr:endocuticle structural glycoprotein SgAbd-5-like [Vanessa cardui]